MVLLILAFYKGLNNQTTWNQKMKQKSTTQKTKNTHKARYILHATARKTGGVDSDAQTNRPTLPFWEIMIASRHLGFLAQ